MDRSMDQPVYKAFLFPLWYDQDPLVKGGTIQERPRNFWGFLGGKEFKIESF